MATLQELIALAPILEALPKPDNFGTGKNIPGLINLAIAGQQGNGALTALSFLNNRPTFFDSQLFRGNVPLGETPNTSSGALRDFVPSDEPSTELGLNRSNNAGNPPGFSAVPRDFVASNTDGQPTINELLNGDPAIRKGLQDLIFSKFGLPLTTSRSEKLPEIAGDITTKLQNVQDALLFAGDVRKQFEGLTLDQIIENTPLLGNNIQAFQTPDITTDLERKRDEVELGLLGRVQNSLQGNLNVNPALLRDIVLEEEKLQNVINRNLGPGGETSEPGIRLRSELRRDSLEALENARRNDLSVASQLANQRSLTSDQNRANAIERLLRVSNAPISEQLGSSGQFLEGSLVPLDFLFNNRVLAVNRHSQGTTGVVQPGINVANTATQLGSALGSISQLPDLVADTLNSGFTGLGGSLSSLGANNSSGLGINDVFSALKTQGGIFNTAVGPVTPENFNNAFNSAVDNITSVATVGDALGGFF